MFIPFGPETALFGPYYQEITRRVEKYLDTKVILIIVCNCDNLGKTSYIEQ